MKECPCIGNLFVSLLTRHKLHIVSATIFDIKWSNCCGEDYIVAAGAALRALLVRTVVLMRNNKAQRLSLQHIYRCMS